MRQPLISKSTKSQFLLVKIAYLEINLKPKPTEEKKKKEKKNMTMCYMHQSVKYPLSKCV